MPDFRGMPLGPAPIETYDAVFGDDMPKTKLDERKVREVQWLKKLQDMVRGQAVVPEAARKYMRRHAPLVNGLLPDDFADLIPTREDQIGDFAYTPKLGPVLEGFTSKGVPAGTRHLNPPPAPQLTAREAPLAVEGRPEYKRLSPYISHGLLTPEQRDIQLGRQKAVASVREIVQRPGDSVKKGGYYMRTYLLPGDEAMSVKTPKNPWENPREVIRRAYLKDILHDEGIAPETHYVATKNKEYLVQPKMQELSNADLRGLYHEGDIDKQHALRAEVQRLRALGVGMPSFPQQGQLELAQKAVAAGIRPGDIHDGNYMKTKDGNYMITDSGRYGMLKGGGKVQTQADREKARQRFIRYGDKNKPWLDQRVAPMVQESQRQPKQSEKDMRELDAIMNELHSRPDNMSLEPDIPENTTGDPDHTAQSTNFDNPKKAAFDKLLEEQMVKRNGKPLGIPHPKTPSPDPMAKAIVDLGEKLDATPLWPSQERQWEADARVDDIINEAFWEDANKPENIKPWEERWHDRDKWREMDREDMNERHADAFRRIAPKWDKWGKKMKKRLDIPAKDWHKWDTETLERELRKLGPRPDIHQSDGLAVDDQDAAYKELLKNLDVLRRKP